MRHIALLVLAFAVAPVACAPLQEPVRIVSGPITGSVADGVRIYKGIPYAQPPIGPLRWREPQLPGPSAQPRAMTEYGPSCPQKDSPLDRDQATVNQSEDCLYLNVWTPAQDTNERLPVMFWIHGGGLVNGSGSKPFYDGASLAKRGVVVVTINYRLGPFGFLTHPNLGAAGNWGILDQTAALKWVRDNIASFGGDPGNVTIFGESAGALSVHVLMASPPARGLFHKAIAQSGAAPREVMTLKQSQAFWRAKATLIGITDWEQALPKLRQTSVPDVLKMYGGMGGLPGISGHDMLCLDGQALTQDPAAAFAAGQEAPVPFIVGSNADEGTLFMQMAAPKTLTGYRLLARRLFGEQADRVLALYPVSSDAEAAPAWAAVVGDLSFTANARRSARWHAAAGHPTWRYFFSHVTALGRRTGLGAFHGSEIPFVFGTLAGSPLAEESGDLSDCMASYWVAFARTGRPFSQGLPSWVAYDPQRDNAIVFDTPLTTQEHLRQAQCDLWDQVPVKKGR